ncbi:hypothetical protein E2C01_039314 [Portunus trituberculatus]|uniref:Endonuclease/exonuclease/phosphatase domain-containing protein n=1 Tax=Portunus trituberculatus TaxID=210409 RepID=A0A5B7FKG6_PORTR|nr:hypothetical protein [Portunus trituberculatus]
MSQETQDLPSPKGGDTYSAGSPQHSTPFPVDPEHAISYSRSSTLKRLPSSGRRTSRPSTISSHLRSQQATTNTLIRDDLNNDPPIASPPSRSHRQPYDTSLTSPGNRRHPPSPSLDICTTIETSEPQLVRHQSLNQDPTTINTPPPAGGSGDAAARGKTLKLSQEILQKANQELQMMVASIHLKQNPSSDHGSSSHRTHGGRHYSRTEHGFNTSIRSRYTQERRHHQQHTPATTNTRPTAPGIQSTTTSILTVNQPTPSTWTDSQPSAPAVSMNQDNAVIFDSKPNAAVPQITDRQQHNPTEINYIYTHATSIIVIQETLASDASLSRFGNYQLFQQPFQQGGSRGLITLVKKDIAATLTENLPHLGGQVESLSVTVHLDNTTKVDIENVYCRQGSHLNPTPLLEHNQGRLTLFAGDFNAHHPVLEPWNGGNNSQRGQYIAHVLEDIEDVKLHGEPQAMHIAGGRLDLLLTINAKNVDMTSINLCQSYSATVRPRGLVSQGAET